MLSVTRRVPFRLLALATTAAAATLGLSQAFSAPASAQQVQPLDHFLCYSIPGPSSTTPAFQPVPGTRLINQFTPNGIVPVIGKHAVLHCNPTAKYINGKLVSQPQNPAAHLLCLPLSKVPVQPTYTVQVTNQFGTGDLIAQQPNTLCLPTWMSLTGPPNQPTPQPPGLYHFTCYNVKYTATSPHFRVPGAVSVADEFHPATIPPTPVKVGAPARLCLPTTKILPTGATYPADLQGLHLLCFSVSETPIINPVFDQNQFGTAQIDIQATKYLCLPSEKTVISVSP